jgi:hypothetical protein
MAASPQLALAGHFLPWPWPELSSYFKWVIFNELNGMMSGSCLAATAL